MSYQRGGAPNEGRRRPSPWALLLGSLTAALVAGGCHRVEMAELTEETISQADKFFDVAHVSGDTFVIVGYRGKVLRSTDAGNTWQEVERPTEWSLTDVDFVGEHGWAVGHNGTVVHTRDGGQTWSPQPSDTDVTLMAVNFAPDRLRGRAS